MRDPASRKMKSTRSAAFSSGWDLSGASTGTSAEFCSGIFLEIQHLRRITGQNSNNHVQHTQRNPHIFGAFMMVFRSDINHFVHQLLNTRRYSSQVSENLGARINQITSSDLSSFEFFFPKENSEMNKIAALLDLLDERIATQNKIIEDLKKLKSAIIEIEYTPNTKTTSHIGNVIEQISKRNKKQCDSKRLVG